MSAKVRFFLVVTSMMLVLAACDRDFPFDPPRYKAQLRLTHALKMEYLDREIVL